MKSIIHFFSFSLLLILFTNVHIFAQDLSVNQASFQLELDGTIEFGELILTNNGAADLEIAMSLEKVCYVEGDLSKVQMCIDQLCFVPTNENITYGESDPLFILGTGENFELCKFAPVPAGEHGSKWRIVFFDRNNPDNNTAVDVDMGECITTGIADFDESIIGNAFPNPSSDVINIPYEVDSENAELYIYSNIGKLMKTVTLEKGSHTQELSIKNFSEGTYFYYIVDGNNRSLTYSIYKNN